MYRLINLIKDHELIYGKTIDTEKVLKMIDVLPERIYRVRFDGGANYQHCTGCKAYFRDFEFKYCPYCGGERID